MIKKIMFLSIFLLSGSVAIAKDTQAYSLFVSDYHTYFTLELFDNLNSLDECNTKVDEQMKRLGDDAHLVQFTCVLKSE